MKRRDAQFWLALLSAATVGFVAVVDMERTSPGPLTSVHQREPDLAGKSGCADCHGGWFSNMTDSCLACHTDIDAQIEAGDGLHGAIRAAQTTQCAVCHSEHHGEGFAIVNKQSFRLAGVPRPGEFDHALIGFEMNGRHIEIGCTDCHEHALDPVLAPGDKRFLGLDQDCASCHDDPHEGRMVVACASCHGQSTWDELHSLGHEKNLPLVGGHADVSCRACHAEADAHSLETLGNGTAELAARQCQECHDSPHAPSFAQGAAQAVSMPVAASCVACHEAEHETFRDERLVLSPELHARSGFALVAPHDQAQCVDCHAPIGREFAVRYPGRSADTCSACHDDPHGGQFADSAVADEGCLACHERTQFAPHAFTVERHELTALPLTGAHVETDCNACHEIAAEGEPRTFHGTPSRCEQCHADAHAGFFAPFAAELSTLQEGECARCHSTTSFSGVPESRFDHAHWTEFPVLGAHAQSECTACHPLTPEPDATGRRFGRVDESFGEAGSCVTCHTDPHGGLFDGEAQPALVAGRSDCARCHVETSWRTFAVAFDHGRWTDFTLVGAHARTDCAGCHAPLRRPDALGRTSTRANGADCADCHTDPHGAQFEVNGVTDCWRCHTDMTPSFLDFDHERDARFPLGDAHAGLECAACHLLDDEDGVEVVRYRPIAFECIDCHGVHEDVLLRKKPRKN